MLTLIGALLLLNISLTFVNVWPTPAVWWNGQLSVELAAMVCALAIAHTWRRTPSPLVVRWLGVGWLVLMLGRYTFVTAPALWGRQLNFYWDLRFLPDVGSMLVRAAAPWLVALVAAAVIAVGTLAYLGVQWAWRRVNLGLADPARRRVLLAMCAAMLALFTAERTVMSDEAPQFFATPVVAGYSDQIRHVVRALSSDGPLPASPSFRSDVSYLHGGDVLLFFIESYGAVAFERPEFAAQLSARRALFESAIHDTGNDVASAFVTSPTFGGSSWFAHITLMSGLDVRDPDTNARLMAEKRETLPAAMARQGYRSVAVMPGLWTPWPEGAFYGFHDIYNGPRLNYRGPSFGWWDMPDQFTLAKLDHAERDRPMRRPLFVFFPTVSTHTPFSPVAPYQQDWPRLLTDRPFDDSALERVWDEGIDWSNLGPGYAKAFNYAYQMLTGYLDKHRGENFVMIVIGDHQPPALVSGEGAPWEVPVHVITSNADVLDRLKASGLTPGLTPTRPALGTMQALLPLLLNAFGEPEARNAN